VFEQPRFSAVGDVSEVICAA